MTEREADEPAPGAGDRDAEETAVPDNPADLPIGEDIPRDMEGVAPAIGPRGERMVDPPAVAPGDERLTSTDHAGRAHADSDNPAGNEEPPG